MQDKVKNIQSSDSAETLLTRVFPMTIQLNDILTNIEITHFLQGHSKYHEIIVSNKQIFLLNFNEITIVYWEIQKSYQNWKKKFVAIEFIL